MSASPTRENSVAELLSDPGAYERRPERVEVIETHASRVFLSGELAYKVKKHVKLPFLDFTTLAQRHKALARELELNQPHAPEIYLEIVAITTGPDGTLAIAGNGRPVDYALKMRRFDQTCLLSQRAGLGPLPGKLCEDLARMVARYHLSAPIFGDSAAVAEMRRTIAALVKEISDFTELFDAKELDAVATHLSKAADNELVLMEERAKHGTVRRCHGDLHLNNIVLLSGHTVPFDALEFDERLAIIDVLYDLAFLLMDLDSRGDRNAANIVLNRYLLEARIGLEIEGLALMPLFLATRALVRAVVSAERTRQVVGGARHTAHAMAERHLQSALSYLDPARPCLIAVGGLSGTGKSTLAARLAPLVGSAPGALHFRSDVERKRLFGVNETVRLGRDAYTQSITDRVYVTVLDKAARSLKAGHSAIVDLVAAKPDERIKIAECAEHLGCAFVGLWLEAPLPALIERVSARKDDASDADAAVVRKQASYETGENRWIRIDAGGTPEQTLARAQSALLEAGISLFTPSGQRSSGT